MTVTRKDAAFFVDLPIVRQLLGANSEADVIAGLRAVVRALSEEGPCGCCTDGRHNFGVLCCLCSGTGKVAQAETGAVEELCRAAEESLKHEDAMCGMGEQCPRGLLRAAIARVREGRK